MMHLRHLLGNQKGMFCHFCERVQERMGAQVDGPELWRILIRLIEERHPDVRFVCRLNRSGRRLWTFDFLGRVWCLVFDHSDGCPVTVFEARGETATHPELGGRKINLEAVR